MRPSKVRYFRPPNQRDPDALAVAQRRLRAQWDEWDNRTRGFLLCDEVGLGKTILRAGPGGRPGGA